MNRHILVYGVLLRECDTFTMSFHVNSKVNSKFKREFKCHLYTFPLSSLSEYSQGLICIP